MFFKVIKAECIKLRRAPVWLAFLTLPALAALMGTFNYLQNQGVLQKEWYSLWTQHTIFTAFFFMPSLIGVLCAYQWRLEHRENNWNSLMCYPVPVWMTVLGKLCVAAGMVALNMIFTGLLFYVSGRYAGLKGALPTQLPRWLALGCCGGICIASVQLFLSMRIKSFAVPVAIALTGGIGGLLIANYGYGLFCPYSLMSMGMNANGSGALGESSVGLFLLCCVIYTALFTALSVESLTKRDIVTH